ncbi:MAG: peptidoglycan DD-metalloendopeptidase family protein [Cyclobacteriaceae bacterium]
MKNWQVIIFSLTVVAVIIYFLIKSQNYSELYYSDVEDIADSTEFIIPPPKLLYGIPIDSLEVEQNIIQNNENLSGILAKYNVSRQAINQLNMVPRDVFDVRKIQARKPYTVIYESDSMSTAKYFIYHPNLIEYVILDFRDSLLVTNGKNDVDTIQEVLTGKISSSLYNAVIDAGGSPLLVHELSDVYAWVIDFFGVQKGDSFKANYVRYEVNGENAGIGKIISAHFNHMGRDFFAFRYDQGEGPEYFDEVGNSLRKAFLKAPLKFSRISSRFSNARRHPVLKITRPHHGVDYAAPVGTPVMSIGDGVVTEKKYNGGAGNMVKIRHNSVYTTAYLHLSKYGEGIRVGGHVRQGQVIGYVGSTGLSTGPHLDFRFYMNGRAIDPLKVEPPSAEPVKEDLRPAYMMLKDSLLQELNTVGFKEDDHSVI